MHVTAVIPARYASVRFPAKALAMLLGKPIVQHVYEAVQATGLFDRVLIATDSEIILSVARLFGAEAVLTSETHQSGSDRIAEAIRDIASDIVFNVQGDEPLIDRTSLAKLKAAFADSGVRVASLMTAIESDTELLNPNIVKVVTDIKDDAIYFSRSPIPYNRDLAPGITYYRHIGVYAYRKEALQHFVELPLSRYESIEKLEQLRLLENRISIRMIKTSYKGIGIDTPEDLILVANILRKEQS